jgi:hypothetical protein
METTARTRDDQVDFVLHKLAVSPNLTLSLHDLYEVPVMDESMYQLDHFMLEKGLMKAVKEGRSMTARGLEIANFGGWVSYKRQLKKDRPINLYSTETLHRKYEVELASLRKELDRQRKELHARTEKEIESSSIIRNLIEQNKSSHLMVFVGGIVTGMVFSSLLWYFLF